MSEASRVTETMTQHLLAMLESDQAPDDRMRYTEAHGYLCACTIRPGPFEPETALRQILSESDTDHAHPELIADVLCLQTFMHQQLLNGEAPELPDDPDADEDTPPLQGWCIGFVEALLEDPESWQGPPEDLFAELTLPILAVSGLLDEDELKELADNQDLVFTFCAQIPDLLIDLFLLYHAPE